MHDILILVKMLEVSSIMKENLVSCEPNCKIEKAIKLMAKNDVGSVVVERGRLVGIFTERDLVKALSKGVSLEAPIREVMSRDPIVALKDESLESIVHKMLERGVRHIPIVDSEGRPIGVISLKDVVRKLYIDCGNI
ncbi:histidine kinase [Ignicoccus islandicus DSM 13165]|uniref:Histidine kinase n=1 Tax=Ignicoccus islandicus DSM 13165 TaxID=940295 RepID=A0A0U2VBA0_9CREN|nr:CBS domain-containing protein [Ignicoccus islandicus]ALU11362.1 histidine kinase [Ignicoccus islandicus DSM 13165]